MNIYRFYVYAYIRSKDTINGKAGTPYYIGKGTGVRAYMKSKNEIGKPIDKNYIIFLETNLSDIGALALERRYIRWYGRIDNNTGMLRNLTDGGEGTSNPSIETRKKFGSRNWSEERLLANRLKLVGRQRSEEFRDKHSLNWIVTKNTGEIIKTRNMIQFCKDNNLNPSIMYMMASGSLKQKFHKGFTCTKILNEIF